MIAEVGTALRALFAPLLPPGGSVRLGPPPAASPGPDGGTGGTGVLNLFLAEVRQDPTAMAADWADVRDETGVLLGRQPPTRRFDLCYLATAHAGDDQGEGRLLDAVLEGLTPERRLDPALLTGRLAAAGAPVLIRFADRGAELHHGYGLPARTVLGFVVNAPLVRPVEKELAPPAERITVDVGRGVRRPSVPPPPRRPSGWRAARIAEDTGAEPGNPGAERENPGAEPGNAGAEPGVEVVADAAGGQAG